MARIVWGLATSHVPSIGAAHDRGLQEDPDWKPLFDGYKPLQEWMADNTPDVSIVVYNDHANALGLEIVPTFGIGVGDSFNVTDEGWGVRPVPTPVGKPEFARFLTKEIIDQGFDLTMFNQLEVDHGLTVPMSVYCPEPGEQWPCPIVPILVNVLQYPQPTAARCYELGKAIGKAVEAYPEDLKVAIFGTGGMSHQLAGTRAGFINEEFDRDFLEKIETDPDALAKLTREELIELAGTEGLELIMWLVMRGAIGDSIRRVADTYFVPASNTAAGAAVFERV